MASAALILYFILTFLNHITLNVDRVNDFNDPAIDCVKNGVGAN